ncbi:sigma-70 family RNA polymerase sigma factor [Phytomonospora sp. NPDC050363]|uniref:RNA polymerase sigma factor n=1 Tax=Phytomonospora sp. NPDC050363 TaxID=3155642 RepID=UPI0033FFAC88
MDPDPLMAIAPCASMTFEEFWSENYVILARRAGYLGAAPGDVEDVVQEAMCDVYRGWQDIVDPLAYAMTALRSHVVRRNTRERRKATTALESAPEPRAHEGAEPERLVEWADPERVERLLSRLTADQRAVMTEIVREQSTAEIAVHLGKSHEAVRKLLERARRRLRQAVAEEASGSVWNPHAGTGGKEDRDLRR